MISLRMIRENSPCASGWRKVREANKHRDIDDMFPMSSILESNDFSDTLWSARCIENQKKLFANFAWWCANKTLTYTRDKCFSDCLVVVKKYIDGNATREELKTVISFTRKAADTIYAAHSRSVYSHVNNAAIHANDSVVHAADAVYSSDDDDDANAVYYDSYIDYVDLAADAADTSSIVAYYSSCALNSAANVFNDSSGVRKEQEEKLKQIIDAGVWLD